MGDPGTKRPGGLTQMVLRSETANEYLGVNFDSEEV